ncbi:hypothetical protein Lser_V15G39521 [Lactuca serriola]
MTKNPIFVLSDTLVVEALNYMAKEQFRQLPVVENGKVIGLLDLLLSLFDETANTETTAENYDKAVEAAHAVQRVTHRALIVEELPRDSAMIIPETKTIYEACCKMVADESDAVVLTGSNDIVTRIIPCGIDIVNTPVSKVMTKKPIFVSYDTLPTEVLPKIVLQGQGTHLLVRENDEDGGFIYHSLSLQGGVLPNTRTSTPKKHKFLDAPQHTSIDPQEQSSRSFPGVNGNGDCYETNGPCLTPFVHVSNSPYPNFDPYDKFVAPTIVPRHLKQSSEPLSSVNDNGEWDETHGPGLTPFTRVSNSAYPNMDHYDKFVAPKALPRHPQQSRQGVNGNDEWDETHGPSLTTFVRMSNSPYTQDSSHTLVAPPPQHTDVRPQEKSSRPLLGVNGSDERDENHGPGFTPLMHVTNSTYPNYSKVAIAPNLNNLVVDLVPPQQHTYLGSPHESSNLLLDVNGKGDDQTNKKSSTNIGVSIERKTVGQMGISEALILSQTTTIYEACCAMALHRADVLVVTNSNELLTGILTNKDIVKTVIASEIDLLNTPVSKVMSNNPSCVMFDTLFVDTLKKMEYKGFTQLPVIQKNGKVTGLFYNTGVSTMTYYEKVLEVAAQGSAPRNGSENEACCRMAVGKFEVVVLTDSDGLLMGILTKKDIVARVIPSAIDIQKTSVSKVMKINEIFLSCDTLPVEAMEDIVKSACLDLLVIENSEDNELLYLPLATSFPY